MKWFGGRESNDVETSSGGGRGLLFGGGILGVIGTLFYVFTGINPSQVFDTGGNSQQIDTRPGGSGGERSQSEKFARVIFEGTTVVWDSLFTAEGQEYQRPIMHLFSEDVNAEGCGFASSATGPFYCPANGKVYLDLTFFDELANKFQAPGEAACAYVIAHEVGHHIQNLMGTTAKLDRARGQMSETEYNKLSVKLELQADFYAGIWVHYTNKNHHNNIIIEPGDLESALNAANQIGDDRLQQQHQGRVSPDSFTHGSSAQRMYWFKKGYDTGDLRQGDTFSSTNL